MEVHIACIVEGHGDVAAVPLLLRRIASELDPSLYIHIPQPLRVPRDKLVKADELERAVEFSARQVGGQGAILILIDSDIECPKTLAPELLARAVRQRSDVPIGLVLAKHEYEAWFLAAATSLACKRGLHADLEAPPDPEAIRGAKEWLRDRMEKGRKYSETLDQPALTQVFDMNVARGSSNSFDKCYREIVRLFTEIQARGNPTFPS
jgi:hypothetical protein